jgi:hypothetical protein
VTYNIRKRKEEEKNIYKKKGVQTVLSRSCSLFLDRGLRLSISQSYKTHTRTNWTNRVTYVRNIQRKQIASVVPSYILCSNRKRFSFVVRWFDRHYTTMLMVSLKRKLPFFFSLFLYNTLYNTLCSNIHHILLHLHQFCLMVLYIGKSQK